MTRAGWRSQSMSTTGRLRRLTLHAHAMAALALMFSLLVFSARKQSPTTDEFIHLVRGLGFWAGDTRLSYEHPPLGNALATIPLALDECNSKLDALAGWADADAQSVASSYVQRDYPTARRNLMRARMAMAAMTVAFAGYLYLLCFELYGRLTARVAVFLVALHPTFLAHGALVTTDMPLAIAVGVSIGEFIRYLRRPRFRQVLRLAMALAMAFACKHSALAVVPVLLVAAVGAAIFGYGRFARSSPGWRALTIAGHLCLCAVAADVVVCAAYRFERVGWTARRMLRAPEPQDSVTRRFKNHLLEP